MKSKETKREEAFLRMKKDAFRDLKNLQKAFDEGRVAPRGFAISGASYRWTRLVDQELRRVMDFQTRFGFKISREEQNQMDEFFAWAGKVLHNPQPLR